MKYLHVIVCWVINTIFYVFFFVNKINEDSVPTIFILNELQPKSIYNFTDKNSRKQSRDHFLKQ